MNELDAKNISVVKEAWDEINPYKKLKTSHEKTILDWIEDFFENCVAKAPNCFLIEYSKLGTLTRCRKGKFTKDTDLFPPPIEIALEKNLVNRWNPPNKRYLYLSHTENATNTIMGYPESEYTCFEEMRASQGVEYTFADFVPIESDQKHFVLNMDYENISTRDINLKYEIRQEIEAIQIAQKFLEAGIFNPTKEELLPMIQKNTPELAAGLIGESLLKTICQAIFIPIDDETHSTGDQRDEAYKSFHLLAQLLEEKDICGVIFPSTRTKLQGYHTQNFVAFTPEHFMIKQNSIRYLTFSLPTPNEQP